MITEDKTFSIGAVSEVTGLGVERLRMWERRYGARPSEKLESGHRRYSVEDLERFTLISHAVRLGVRARNVLSLSIPEIRAYCDHHIGEGLLLHRSYVDEIIRAGRALDSVGLQNTLTDALDNCDSLDFLIYVVVPAIKKIGELWASKQLDVSTEHLISERVEDFLSAIWHSNNNPTKQPTLLLTTPPGELHRLGLQYVASIGVLCGVGVVNLGPSTPLDDIGNAVSGIEVAIVGISISQTYSPENAQHFLNSLAEVLPENVTLVSGGVQAQSVHPRVMQFSRLLDFYAWITARRMLYGSS